METLEVPDRNITDETLQSWSELSKLKRLNLQNTLVENPAVWPDWPLQELALSRTRLDDEDFARLLKYEDLKVLMADNTGFGDAVNALAALPKLEELVVQPSRVTPASWELFASYPALKPTQEFRWFSYCAVRPAKPVLQIKPDDGEMDQAIGALPPAREVYESYRFAMKRLKKSRHESVSVNRSIPVISNYEFSGIDALYVLELDLLPDGKSVCLTSPYLDDELLACVRSFPNLETLELDGSWITDGGLHQLAQCPKLRKLSLENTRISDDGLRHLLRACPQLKFLNLAGTRVSHRGMKQLSKFKELENLILPLGALRGQQLLELQQLPELTHLYVAPPGAWDRHSRLAEPWNAEDLRAIRSLESTNGLPPGDRRFQSPVAFYRLIWCDLIGSSQNFYIRMTFTPEAFEMLSSEQQAEIRKSQGQVCSRAIFRDR